LKTSIEIGCYITNNNTAEPCEKIYLKETENAREREKKEKL